MIRTRTAAWLLPALAVTLAGCCCERPRRSRSNPHPEWTIVCPSPAPAAPLPADAAAPSKLVVYDVRDLVSASDLNAKLLADLRPALPADAQAFIQGDSVILVKTTAAGQEAAARWLADRRKAVTPVMMAVDVVDLTATTPIDTLVERLRAALPSGVQVNRQGTGTLVVKGTPAEHAQVGALLAELRMAAMPPK